MSQDPFWRNLKAGASVHTGDIQGRATPNEGVTGGVKRFKVRQLSQWTVGGSDLAPYTCNLELLGDFFSPLFLH